jgi:tripartite ATP-independent transporter DctM subunit
MIAFATSLIGHWHGGLALAGILACAMFALVCGSSVATVVAIGSIILPEMVRRGYPMRIGAGVITVAGWLGILMLPSIPKVIYATSTNTSIGALFVAGLLPGSMLTATLCAVTWYIARKHDYPRLERARWPETWRAFRQSVGGLMLVVIIIGGIYSGIFTATEAAAMGAVYAFIISVYVYGEMRLKDVPRVLLSSANMSATSWSIAGCVQREANSRRLTSTPHDAGTDINHHEAPVQALAALRSIATLLSRTSRQLPGWPIARRSLRQQQAPWSGDGGSARRLQDRTGPGTARSRAGPPMRPRPPMLPWQD